MQPANALPLLAVLLFLALAPATPALTALAPAQRQTRDACASRCFRMRANAERACARRAPRVGCRVRACMRVDERRGFHCAAGRPACPTQCFARRVRATRNCAQPAARALGCVVRRCRRADTRFGFACRRPFFPPMVTTRPSLSPSPSPSPSASMACPQICIPDRATAEALCAQRVVVAMGCVLRGCGLPDGSVGSICVLPVQGVTFISATPSPSGTPSPSSLAPGASPSPSSSVSPSPSVSASVTPSLSVSPSPSMMCEFSLQGGFGEVALDGVCRCGDSSRTVLVLSNALAAQDVDCYNQCLQRSLTNSCSPNLFSMFISASLADVTACCTACGGNPMPATNRCVAA